MLWFGASLVESQELTIGQLVQFIIYTVFIGASVGGLGDMYGKVQTSLGAADRILEILDEAEEPTNKTSQSSQVLTVEGNIEYDQVSFSYPTRPDIAVLKNISFQIQSGEKVALVGPSGAGKSTIVALLMKFYNLKGGHIRIDGEDINHLNLTALRQNIGIVPQEVLLFGGTIRENIAYGKPNATEEEIIQAAKQANNNKRNKSAPEVRRF